MVRSNPGVSTGTSRTLDFGPPAAMRGALRAFHAKHYRPERMRVVIAGPQVLRSARPPRSAPARPGPATGRSDPDALPAARGVSQRAVPSAGWPARHAARHAARRRGQRRGCMVRPVAAAREAARVRRRDLRQAAATAAGTRNPEGCSPAAPARRAARADSAVKRAVGSAVLVSVLTDWSRAAAAGASGRAAADVPSDGVRAAAAVIRRPADQDARAARRAVRARTLTRAHAHARARTHTHTRTHAHARTRTHTHARTLTHTHAHARTLTHAHARTHAHAHARTHAHTHTHT
jgi:hypothetical protein